MARATNFGPINLGSTSQSEFGLDERGLQLGRRFMRWLDTQFQDNVGPDKGWHLNN